MNRISEKEFLTAQGIIPEPYRSQLALLVETPRGSVVLDRDFGVDFSCLDSPPPIAQAQLAGELAEQITRYIPELTLVEVRLISIDSDGKLAMKVVVDYAGESL